MKKIIRRTFLFSSIICVLSGIVLGYIAPDYMGLTRSLMYRNAKLLEVLNFKFNYILLIVLICLSIFISNKKIITHNYSKICFIQIIIPIVTVLVYLTLNSTNFLGIPYIFIGLIFMNLYLILK